METKYFMHRIKRQSGEYTKGIEVHDTLDSAILSFHGYMKQAYGNVALPDIDFVCCFVTDGSGSVVRPFAATWFGGDLTNQFFLHYIRHNGEIYTKDIDVCDSYDAAKQAFHAQLEYGYNNSKFANVSFVSCQITDKSGSILMTETWNKPDPEPVPPEPEE